MSRHRVALVIGNASYAGASPLKNTINDAEDIAAKLEAFEFTVIKRTDCTAKEMDVALKDFKGLLVGNEVGLFFFAGHGMQIEGENYLAAVDTDISGEIEARHTSLPLNRVIQTIEKSAVATSVIVLDACRDNPYERAWQRSAGTRGLAPVYAPKGTLIAYATSPGQVASDGHGRNGAYTAALLQHIGTPDCSLETMFKRVRNTLSAATKQRQISWEHTSLSGEFFFNLSIGARIDAYTASALSDRLFVVDEARPVHRLIRELKTLTWPRQNPAVDGFTSAEANTFSTDELFVVGRNIYQSACGGSRSAAAYLRDFATKTKGIESTKRKAVLDGVLFEVFFDSRAQLRPRPKEWYGDDVFALQQFPELSPSFGFVSECLLTYADRFYALPGKHHETAVDVVTRPNTNGPRIVESVVLAGSNILWFEPDGYLLHFASQQQPGTVRYETLSPDAFEKRLSRDMIVPRHLLKVTYDFDRGSIHSLTVQAGNTTRKRS